MFEYLRSIFALYDNAHVDLCDAVKKEPFDGKGSERKEKRRKMHKGKERGKKASMRWSRGATGIPGPRTLQVVSADLTHPPSLFPFVVVFPSPLPPFLSFFSPLCFRVSVESCSFPALPSSFVLSLSRGS